MSYTKYETKRNDTWERKEGASVEGVYARKRTVTTENGESRLYTIEKKGGKEIDLWGTKMLDDFFTNMVIGTDVQIKYIGKKKTAKGGKTYHDYELGYNKDTAPAKDIVDVAKEEFDM